MSSHSQTREGGRSTLHTWWASGCSVQSTPRPVFDPTLTFKCQSVCVPKRRCLPPPPPIFLFVLFLFVCFKCMFMQMQRCMARNRVNNHWGQGCMCSFLLACMCMCMCVCVCVCVFNCVCARVCVCSIVCVRVAFVLFLSVYFCVSQPTFWTVFSAVAFE